MSAISPFFVVNDVERTIDFYRERLGFEVSHTQPAEEPFFAVIRRDGAQLFIKSEDGVRAIPNSTRSTSLRWDAFVYSPDPDGLCAELRQRETTLSAPLENTHDGLRGFEVTDPNGYVLFFGRPR